MPELPEVETIVRGLRLELACRTFAGVRVLWERTVDRPDVITFGAALKGAGVVDVTRRGKFIVLHLDTGQALLAHLRMTGKLLVQPAAGAKSLTLHEDPYARVILGLDDGRRLVFSDTRKFGRMYLVDDPLEVVGELGPEPLAADFDPERLTEMLAGHRGRIKSLLLNQSFVAGLGNIYTDEALWRAGVHPLRPAGTLAPQEVARLHRGIVSVLREAIADGGTSLRDNQYRQPDGDAGAYQDLLAVYGRAGQACLRCGAMVERLVVGQRGTHICPTCQVLPSHNSL